MRYLGIDYGTKKIGLAISDESGAFAFPKTIVASGVQALRDIVTIVTDEQVETIVVGHSLNSLGERNAVMEDIDAFIEELHKLTGLPVVLSDERFSSTAVKAFDWTKPVASPRRTDRDASGRNKTDPIDDRAAAIMLQRYLDKNR
jgi:putative Holliday junction resolvase